MVYDVKEAGVPNRDSRVQRVQIGLQWEITGRSRGLVKGGYEEKKFSDPARRPFTGIVMEAALDHQLAKRHALRLQADQATRESNLTTSDYLLTTGVSVEDRQQFSDKTSMVLVGGYRRDDYPQSVLVRGRRDETWQAGGGLDYAFHDWVRAGFRYLRVWLDSATDESDYVANTYALSLALVF